MKRASVVTGLLAALLLPLPAGAGPSKTVRVTSYKDFAEGQDQGVLLSSDGSVQTGLRSERLSLPSLADDSVRALAQQSDGTTYVGTGGESPGVLTYAPGGKLLRPLVRLPAQTWVSALCALPSGEVLAATAQDGRVFALSRDGKVRVYGQVEAEHVWALQYDPQRRVTYVTTGPGRLYALDAQGRASKLFDSGTKQILSLDLVGDALYVGTADEAVLYRVELGRGRDLPKAPVVHAVHDFAGNEVRAIAHHDGVVYVAVNDMARAQGGGGVKITPPAAGSAPGSSKSLGASSSGKGALYRLDESGRVEQLHAISDGFFNALASDAAGDLYAAASTPGGRGRVYLIRPDRTVLTAVELKESDVLALQLGTKGEHLLGTGNSGALYRVSLSAPKDGHYLSKVFDGQFLSRWGTLRFLGAGDLRLETRSGNLAKPDATWSAWESLGKPDRTAAPGELAAKIRSPLGRYLQVRAFLGERSVLRDFSLSYQPLNQRPRVLEIAIGEDPLGRLARGVRPASTSSPPAPRTRQPLVKLRFRVENPDEDDLSYRVYVRQVQTPPQAPQSPANPTARDSSTETGWLRLGGAEPLSKPEYEWNTETVPDGVYELRVVVSDERSNGVGEALAHELISAPFVVDSRKPELVGVSYANGALSGKAVDATSPLAELAYAVDGGEFLPIAARDGVLDDLVEEFSFRLPVLSPGVHTVIVRATDAADNAASQQVLISVRP